MQRIAGGCHCGTITFVLYSPAGSESLPVRACTCSFCRGHGAVYTSHREGALDVVVRDRSGLARYTFATATAEFFVCRHCGVMPLVTSTIEGRQYAVVNVNACDGVEREALIASATCFDGESVEQRLQRRKRTWIPNVTVTFAEDAQRSG